MKKKTKKKVPKFNSEADEQAFWAKADATEYFYVSKAKKLTMPNLKPSTKTISLRLSEEMLEELKAIANQHDVPYQSLIKFFLKERIDQEKESA